MLLLSVGFLGGVGTEGEKEGPTRGNRKNSREDLAVVDDPAVSLA